MDPGGSATVRLRLRNTGDVVDEYRFEPVGAVAPWTTVEPATLRLYPGTTGTVELTFAPPRTPDATAGPNPFAVCITPTEHPEAVTVPEGNLTVTPFSEVRAELVPPTVKGRFRGRPRLAIDNLGNTTLTASISGSDNGDELSYEIRPGNVQIEPGRAAFVKATLKPREIIWFGSKQQRPYTLSVHRSGTAPLAVDGRYVQRGFLPGWLATFFGVLLALTVTFVLLWIAYKPDVRSAAVEQLQEAGASAIPPPGKDGAPPLAPPSSPPPAEPAPSKAPDPQAGGGGGGSGGGGGGGAPKPPTGEKKPEPHTVSNVLLRLRPVKLCADLPGNGVAERGAAGSTATCNPGTEDNQLWNLDLVSKDKGPYGAALFQIRNVKNGNCLDLPGGFGEKPTGTEVASFGCNGNLTGNQLWWLEKQDGETYWIRNHTSNGRCLDWTGPSTSRESARLRLRINDCRKGEDLWQIVNPTRPDWQIVHPLG
ncbi:ricin-type beta-trefoil lectin domain protein [Streptomyces polychromogenes]|uniref:Ricin-type beta-trefoil lectin domain protein n=1 Tax=Streptomyces polychromogenes TaxID=67342 RepID=A0ABN0VH27_9ACTN